MIEVAKKLLDKLYDATSSDSLKWEEQGDNKFVCIIATSCIELETGISDDNKDVKSFTIKDNGDTLYSIHRTLDSDEDYNSIKLLYDIVKEKVIK